MKQQIKEKIFKKAKKFKNFSKTQAKRRGQNNKVEVIITWKNFFLPKRFASGIFDDSLFSVEAHQNSQQNIALLETNPKPN